MRVRRIYREILIRTEKGVKKNAHVCINVFFLRFFFFYVHRRNKLVLYARVCLFDAIPHDLPGIPRGLSNFFLENPYLVKATGVYCFPDRQQQTVSGRRIVRIDFKRNLISPVSK